MGLKEISHELRTAGYVDYCTRVQVHLNEGEHLLDGMRRHFQDKAWLKSIREKYRQYFWIIKDKASGKCVAKIRNDVIDAVDLDDFFTYKCYDHDSFEENGSDVHTEDLTFNQFVVLASFLASVFDEYNTGAFLEFYDYDGREIKGEELSRFIPHFDEPGFFPVPGKHTKEYCEEKFPRRYKKKRDYLYYFVLQDISSIKH